MATASAEKGHPFAAQFRDLIWNSGADPDEPGLLLAEMVARQDLEDHEAVPASIVFNAIVTAAQSGDAEALRGAILLGTQLLARWPDYLVSLQTHPEFIRRPDQPT